jgi:pSer/pThr/pTyr-binding forkhead associated (FHA) protein
MGKDEKPTVYKPAPDSFLYDFKATGLNVLLTVTKGADKGKSAKVEDTPFIIGRDEDVDFPISDEAVSRTHSIIIYENGKLYIRDMDSKNGTYLNGRRITKEELKNGDILRIGDTTIKVEIF